MSQLLLPGNATPADVLASVTFSAGSNYNTAGTMVNRTAGANPATGTGQWPDGGLAVYLEGGYYAAGAGPGEVKVTTAQLQASEGDLIASNIVSGKNIYGVVGTFAGVDLINISAPTLVGENNTTATIKKSVTMNKAGNVTVRAGMRNPNVNGDVTGYFRKNGVQFPSGVYGVGSNQTPSYWSANISVVPGDVIDVVTWSSNGGAYNGVQDLTIVTTMPSSPTGGTITLGA